MDGVVEHMLLTPDEVAAILRVEQAVVDDLVRRGELTALRIGGQYRIPREAVVQFVSAGLRDQRMRILQHVLEDPKTWARAVREQPELENEIRAGTYRADHIYAMVQQGLTAVDAEGAHDNVVPLRRRDDEKSRWVDGL
jgi:excisionase family DNA binding protein